MVTTNRNILAPIVVFALLAASLSIAAMGSASPARGVDGSVSEDLQGLLPSGNGEDDKAINKAIDAIEDAHDPDLWVDATHPDPEDGEKVFHSLKEAVEELEEVEGGAMEGAQSATAALTASARELATTAIGEASAAGADVAKAEKKLADGDDQSEPAEAISKYQKAWEKAIKALGRVEVRFSAFNASLNRFTEGALMAELSTPGSAQPDAIAEIIQRARPDVLLINEFDYDAGNVALDAFQSNYLSMPHGSAAPIVYPYRYTAPSNTGIFSGFDLDNSGMAGDFVPNDSFGFGFFPGQFGMAVYSKYPIDLSDVRTFQKFLWKDMPGALLPEDPPGTPWYSPEALNVFRLSSKSHWDLPIVIGDKTVHFLTSHPTPPVFDGPEDRNGTRNHDEIRFWADYVSGEDDASYIYDDNGQYGGLDDDDNFVIAGDQNSDPLDGDSIPGAINQLLDSPRVNTEVTPSSPGGTEQSAAQGNANTLHLSDPAFDTADFFDGFPPAPFGGAPGDLRTDYVLPSEEMKVLDSAVFWPLAEDPLFPLVGTFPFPSSDHRLVWIDTLLD